MKKLNLILLTTIMLSIVSFFKSHAQIAMTSVHSSSDDEAMISSKIPTDTSAAVNQKADKNFHNDYQRAIGAEWSVLADKSLMCRFFKNNILYRAFYTPHGNW